MAAKSAEHAHIEHLVATKLPQSPIYNFLLAPVRITHASKGLMLARLTLSENDMNVGKSLHGSVSATIVDWAGGMAVSTWYLREKTGVSVDIHVTYQSGAKVGTAKVQLGSDSEVDLVAPRNLAMTVPAGLGSGQTKLKIRYQGPIKAPIAKGQHVADLVILTADTAPQIVPLVAGEEVSEAGIFGRIWLGFKQLFGMA